MYLLFDIGGTSMRIAFSKDRETFKEAKIVPTPQQFKEGILLFQEIAKDLSNGEKIEAVAGGIPGPFDQKGVLGNLPNLPGWRDKPLKEELEKACQAPVFLENDTNLVGLGEAHIGAGKGKHIVVYLTLSTGVGGTRIIGEKIDVNAMGFEPGHQFIDIQSTEPCGCGGQGHLESLVSGSALERKYGKKPKEITDPKIWEEVARILAYGLNNVLVYWSPDIIVLGGSLITKDDGISIERVEEHLKNILTIFPKAPPIKKAQLGDEGGLYGALIFAKQQLSQ